MISLTNSTHHSSCNPSKNSNVFNSCCKEKVSWGFFSKWQFGDGLFFIAMNNVHWTLQPTCSHLGPAVRTLHIYGARAKHPTKKQVTLWRIILNTWEQHTDAGPVQGLEAGQAVEACTAAVEIFFKLLFFLFLLCSSLSSFLDPSRSISKLAPGKVSIVFLQKLPDQDTPVVTSHGLGRVGVGLPCCLCLSFPLISATT